MNYSVKRISLDIHSTSSRETVNTKRGDTGRKIYISLVDGGIPYIISEDCHAVFTAKKPDGKIVFNDCAIDNNTIIYEVTEQTVAVEGRVDCEIKLYGADNKLITSAKFTIAVFGTVYNEGDEIESSDEFSALTKMMGDAIEATENANEAADEANRVAQDLLDARDNGEFTGPGIIILGSYNTEAELIAAHPIGEIGGYYLVGTDLYIWSAKENKWLNVGNIQGTNGYAPVITIASEEALSAALLTIYQSMSDGYAKTFRMSITVANLSIGGGIWFVTVYRATTKYGFAEAVRYGGSGGLFYTNNLQEGTWSGWTNISPSRFAPSGYGLNNDFKTTANAADMDGYLTNGWYKYLNDAGVTLVPGFVIYYALCRVDSYSTAYVVQTLYPRGYTGCSLQRYCSSGVWSEWGWVNPPLTTNVEYRTTKRYKGAAVYEKVDTNGNILWRSENETTWHLLASADYVATATVE